MTVESRILFSLCLGSLALYAIAGRTMFATPHGVPSGMKRVALCFILSAVFQTAAIARQQELNRFIFAFALALYVTALALFLAARHANRNRWLSVAYSPDLPEHLVTHGPYGFIRHPFYTAYCTTWLAGAISVVSSQPAVFLTVLLMGSLYVWAARFEERKYAECHLASAYENYKRRTGMFFIKLPLRRRPQTADRPRSFARSAPTLAYIRDEVGDVRSFSLDSPESREPKLKALRAAR